MANNNVQGFAGGYDVVQKAINDYIATSPSINVLKTQFIVNDSNSFGMVWSGDIKSVESTKDVIIFGGGFNEIIANANNFFNQNPGIHVQNVEFSINEQNSFCMISHSS